MPTGTSRIGLTLALAFASGCTDASAFAAEVPLTADPCTKVSLTSPGAGFSAAVGASLTLTGVAECPVTKTPEYEYWAKPASAPNWTIVSGYLPGSFLWVPDTTGDWCVTVVARAVGSTDSFQARSTARCGTIGAPSAPRTVIVPVAPPMVPGPLNQISAVISGAGSGTQPLFVQLPTTVGQTIASIRVRLTDSAIGPTTARVKLLSSSDGSQQFTVVAASVASSGAGEEQTITLPVSVVASPNTQYTAMVSTALGQDPCQVWRMEMDVE